VSPPDDLDAPQRKAFRKIIKALENRGIDAITRVDLVAEYVRLGARLDALRGAENGVEIGTNLATTRALNVATVERRRLHEAIFRGAGKQVAVNRPRETDADAAWRPFLHRPYGRRPGETQAMWQARRDAVEAEH